MSFANGFSWIGLAVACVIVGLIVANAIKNSRRSSIRNGGGGPPLPTREQMDSAIREAVTAAVESHPTLLKLANASGVETTRAQTLRRLVREYRDEGDLIAAELWGDKVTRRQANKSFAEYRDTFSDDEPEADPPAEEEPAEEEAEAPARPRRTRTTS